MTGIPSKRRQTVPEARDAADKMVREWSIGEYQAGLRERPLTDPLQTLKDELNRALVQQHEDLVGRIIKLKREIRDGDWIATDSYARDRATTAISLAKAASGRAEQVSAAMVPIEHRARAAMQAALLARRVTMIWRITVVAALVGLWWLS